MTTQAANTLEDVTDTAAATAYAAPYAAEAENKEADVLDRAGNALVALINRAARTVEADVLAAREVAEKLADQLRAAQSRINELEANVRYYKDRTERAEKWMHQISSEIHQTLLGGGDTNGTRRVAERRPQNQDKPRAMPRPRRQEPPATPGFLRRLTEH